MNPYSSKQKKVVVAAPGSTTLADITSDPDTKGKIIKIDKFVWSSNAAGDITFNNGTDDTNLPKFFGFKDLFLDFSNAQYIGNDGLEFPRNAPAKIVTTQAGEAWFRYHGE